MSNCPVCDTWPTDEFGDLRRCPSCAHVFQLPAIVTAVYDADYVGRYAAYPTDEMSLLRVGFLKAHVSTGRLLDVGYGNGAFLRTAQAAGFETFGHEIHGGDFGIDEVNIRTDSSLWDVVTFFDSLEHFPDFEVVRSLVRRSRFVLVSLPLYPPEFPAIRTWKHYKPGEHLHYFSRESLRRLVGQELIMASNLEDVIRRPSNCHQNILTCLFANQVVSPGWTISGTSKMTGRELNQDASIVGAQRM